MYQSGSLLEQNNAKERNQRMVCRSKTKITEWWGDLLAVIIVVSIQDMVWTEWEYYLWTLCNVLMNLMEDIYNQDV